MILQGSPHAPGMRMFPACPSIITGLEIVFMTFSFFHILALSFSLPSELPCVAHQLLYNPTGVILALPAPSSEM